MRFGTFLAAFLVFPALAVSATIYVPDDHASIQGAINAANSGDTVIVRPGTYFENINFGHKEITVRSEQGAVVTTIDGNQSGSVVRFSGGVGLDIVLDGFTITNGTGTGDGYRYCGGGIYWDNYSDSTVKNNIIIGNTADLGGGIGCHGGYEPIIDNNIITENMASDEGGGIGATSFPSITNNIISKNVALNKGGGIRCSATFGTMENNIITENMAGKGGGIFHSGEWDALHILSCVVANNTAYHGGGIYCDHFCCPTIEKSTITGNQANYGGGIYCYNSDAYITSSILWDNSAWNGPEIYTSGMASLEISYSDIQGGWYGMGNIDADPLFFDPANGDYHLQQDPCQPSVFNPCVDTGNPSTLCGGTTRTDGVRDSWPADMGYHYPAESQYIFYVPDDYPTIQGAIDASANGDIIIVRPGTYVENIGFRGLDITVKSEQGAEVTTIDGNQDGAVVGIGGEGTKAVLDGFTITNGNNGIFCRDSSPTITNNVILGNTTIHGGGGIYCEDSSATIVNNTIIGNTADFGGGINCEGSPSPTIINNIISNNTAANQGWLGGGGICCRGYSPPTIVNNTITGNTAVDEGGGIFCGDSTVTISNTIFWGNSAPEGKEIWVGEIHSTSSVSINYSDVEGGQESVHVDPGSTLNWGAGMIDADPLFADAAAGDYHLTVDSPCIDSGDKSVVIGAYDFEEDPRVALGYAVDMGADEYWFHTYHLGRVIPGSLIDVKVVGWPTAPVLLALDDSLADPPIPTPHGDLFLAWPPIWYGYAGNVPGNGILTLPVTVPLSWSSGDIYFLQSLVGPWGGPLTRLTNAEALTVE